MNIFEKLEGTYKSSYKLDDFNLGLFKSALEKYPIVETTLQQKLAYVRRQIANQEELDKWIKPRLDQMKEGMKCKIGTSWGMQNGTWPTVLKLDTHVNLFGGKTLESKFKCADIYVLKSDLTDV